LRSTIIVITSILRELKFNHQIRLHRLDRLARPGLG